MIAINIANFEAVAIDDFHSVFHLWEDTHKDCQNISDDLLKELMDMDAAIYKANEKMTFLANDKEVLRLYNMREMAQIDYNSGMRKAKEGGIVEGKIERNIEIAGI